MNKRHLTGVLSAAIALTACFGFAACSGGEKPTDKPEPSENLNVYGGEGDFVFAKWQAESSYVYTEITENDDGSAFFRYVKSGSADSYCGIYSEISGLTDKFGYLNVTVSGQEGKTLLMRIGDSTVSSLLLGTDKIVSVSGEATTYSWEINASNKWMLNRADQVTLIAEPGQNGSSNVGTMTVYKAWFSETLPEGSSTAKSSDWVNGGNYKITQAGDVTQVGYAGISPSTWQNIYLPVADHNAAEQNTAEMTLVNTGDSTVYLSIKSVAADDQNDSSQLTWDNVVLEPGESKTLKISLAKNIRSFVAFVCSADNVPAGVYSGSFTISEVKFYYTDPAEICMWQATSMYTLEKGAGRGTFTYTALKNGDWNQNINTAVDHDLTAQNAVALTVTNRGETEAHYFVKAQGDGGEHINGDAFTLGAGESKTVLLQLTKRVTSMVVWVNADAYSGSEADTSAGAVELTNPVFTHEDFFVAADWNHSDGFAVEKGDGVNSISYTGLASGAWNQNVSTALDHDASAHNVIKLTLTNTGESPAHYFVKAQSGTAQIAGETFDLPAGESKEVVLGVNEKAESIVIWVNADAQPEGASGDGSFTVTDPVYGYVKANPWSGSSVYQMTAEEDDSVSVSFEGVQNNTWSNISRTVSCDYNLFNTMRMTFTNAGGGTLYLYLTTQSGGSDNSWNPVTVEAGEKKTVTIDLPSAIDKVIMFICSDSTAPEGTYSGSFAFTQPEFFWKGTVTAGGAYSAVRDEESITVVYTDLTANWGSFVNASVRHNGTDDTARFTVTNGGTEAVHLYIKLVNANNEEVKSAVFDLSAGESKEVVFTEIGQTVTILQIYINTDDVPEGVENPSSGKIVVTEPVFAPSEAE